jgi:hypothetical protein
MSNVLTPASDPAPSFDIAAIREFIERLHTLAKGCDGKLVISAFNGDQPGTITHHQIGDVDGMVAAIVAQASTPGANVFSGLQLMRSDLPRGSRGGKVDITVSLGLVADMDADTGKIGALPVEPSYIVETSPGNSQQVILFDKPMTPTNAQRLAKALQTATGSDSGTGDIAHVWRIPGTLNYPNAAKIARGRSPEPAAVFVTEPFLGEVHTIEKLTTALAEFITENKTATGQEAQFTSTVDSAPLWERLTGNGRDILTADGLPDRSVHAARVVEQLHFEGFSLDEAVSLCDARGGEWMARYDYEVDFIADIERCWNKWVARREAQQRANAKAAIDIIDRVHAKRARVALTVQSDRAVKATPFVFRDPTTIPKRETLYAGHFNRRFLSSTIGAGGGGKSTIVIADALAMASGRSLVGHQPVKALKIWYINLEDPADEIERRIAATVLYYKIDPAVLNRNLFVDSGRDQMFVVVKQDGRGTKVIEPVVAAIIQEMKDKGIDVLIVDPFISTHEVDENDNSKIQQVAAQFVRIANEANVAVELVHHVNKTAGDGKGEVTADSARGASALKDKARSIRTINTMSKDEATKAGIDPNERFSFVRVSNGKSSMKKRSGHSDWSELVSVNLGNNGKYWEPGDSVGVATEWKWPSSELLADAVTPEQLEEIKSIIRAGQFKSNGQAWGGQGTALRHCDPPHHPLILIRGMVVVEQ